MEILGRIAHKLPIKGYLAECNGVSRLFKTMEEAQNWIYSQPDWARQNPNEMPTISFGWYKNVIMCI
jgi:hypothetical protein